MIKNKTKRKDVYKALIELAEFAKTDKTKGMELSDDDLAIYDTDAWIKLHSKDKNKTSKLHK